VWLVWFGTTYKSLDEVERKEKAITVEFMIVWEKRNNGLNREVKEVVVVSGSVWNM